MADRIDVLIETSPTRVFAAALDWPGWVRAGKTEEAALAALAATAPRFAPVAATAGHPIPEDPAFVVAERREGNATTAFGAPDVRADADARPTDVTEGERLGAFLDAAWCELARVASGAPAELRKGPRGGGRDRDAVVAHVIGAENSYSRVIGVKHPEVAPGDVPALTALRDAMRAAVAAPSDGSPIAAKKWPPRYAARRIAWHVLDHAWEIEDRSGPG